MVRFNQKLLCSILILLVSIPLVSTVLAPVGPAVSWSPFNRLTWGIDFDYNPTGIQTTDGKVWLFWQTAAGAIPGPPPIPDIVYKTWDWAQWPANGNLSQGGSPITTLVSTTSQDILPSVAQASNGTLFLSFTSDRTGNFEVYLKKYTPSTGWSADAPMTTSGDREETSSIVAASDGSLWLFFDRLTLSTNSQNIYYKKYTPGTGWSGETALTSGVYPVRNRQPTAYQAKDGRIWLTYSQVQDTQFNKVYIYYRIYNGSTWLSSLQLTLTGPDRSPAIIQAQDTTLTIIWSREVPLPGSCNQEDLFYVTSTDNGTTFSSEGRLMDDRPLSDCANDITVDDIEPTLIILRDFKFWVFWSTDRDSQNWWELYYTSSNTFPVHDVAVKTITAAPLLLRSGQTVTVNVTVINQGSYTETMTVNTLATNTTTITVNTRTVTLASWASSTFQVTWNTQGVTPARWKISVNITPVAGELTVNQANNSLNDGSVHLVPPGDVNYDGKVDILDAGLLSVAYDSRPGDPLWNPNADLNYDGVIDIVDAGTLAFWYGATS